MSWNNVLPWWVYENIHEQELAKMSCCFYDELCSGTFKVTPDHVYYIHPSNFSSWDEGGWNFEKEQPSEFRVLYVDNKD